MAKRVLVYDESDGVRFHPVEIDSYTNISIFNVMAIYRRRGYQVRVHPDFKDITGEKGILISKGTFSPERKGK